MRRITILALAGGVAMFAAAGAGGATASNQQPSATKSGALVKIGGPKRLKARRKVRFPVFCSATCNVVVRAKLTRPNLPPLVLSGVIPGGSGRPVQLTLNGPATRVLKRRFRAARLKVVARATDAETGAADSARKVFRFRR